MKYAVKRKRHLDRIREKFDILTADYDGHQQFGQKITVRNKKCLHVFEVCPRNLVTRNINCPTCNKDSKRNKMRAFNEKRHQEAQKRLIGWAAYKHRVYMLTRSSFKKYKQQINPENLPVGRAGVVGAYHLDHIKSVKYCFENNVTPEDCAHWSNLQMLPWLDNIRKR